MLSPRSYGGTAIMIGGLSALPYGLLSSWFLAVSQQRPLAETLTAGLGIGMLFGVLFGLAMAFFFQGTTATLGIHNKEVFRARVNVATSELGYFPATQSPDFLTYKPSWQAGLAVGRISIQLEGDRAVVVGPKTYVKDLLKRLGAG
jgi:hypothetical protein